MRGRVEAYHRRAALCLRVESAAVHDDTTATADVTESWPRRSDDSGEVIVLEVPPLGQDVAGSVVDSESEGSPAKSEEETGRHCSGDAIVPLPFEDAARPLAGLGAASHPRGDRAARDAPPAEDAPREDLPSLSLGSFTVGGIFSLGTGDSLLGRIADVPPAIPPINLNDAYKNYDSVDEDGDADEDEEEADDEDGDEERGCIPAEVTVGVSLPEPPEEHAGEQPPPLPPRWRGSPPPRGPTRRGATRPRPARRSNGSGARPTRGRTTRPSSRRPSSRSSKAFPSASIMTPRPPSPWRRFTKRACASRTRDPRAGGETSTSGSSWWGRTCSRCIKIT